MPYKHRQSIKSTDKQLRDMIFMGHVVVYRVNESKNRIEIIGIFNANEWGGIVAGTSFTLCTAGQTYVIPWQYKVWSV